jgi:hypothetical protein
LSSILLYPKTLGGGAVFSGWVPFNSSIMEQVSPDAKRVRLAKDKCFLILEWEHVDSPVFYSKIVSSAVFMFLW